jgi:drug/metabolite transporter, DME family
MSDSSSASSPSTARHSLAVSRACALAAAVLFSTGGAAIKSTVFDSWQVAGFRSGVAAVFLLLVFPQARKLWNWRILLVGAFYTATMLLYVIANKLTTAANTIFLQYTAPLYLLLSGPFLLKEPIRRRDLYFMAFVAGGMLLFFAGRQAATSTAPNPEAGNLLAALSGLTWAATISGLRWLGTHEDLHRASMATVAAGNLLAFALCLPLALPVGSVHTADWAIVGYMGVFQIGFAYFFLVAAIRGLPALEASLLLLIEPALNPVWAWAIQGERPNNWAILGGALILTVTIGKTILDQRWERTRKRKG